MKPNPTAPAKPKRKTIYRDSETGRITTREYATRNPKTTEQERVKK